MAEFNFSKDTYEDLCKPSNLDVARVKSMVDTLSDEDRHTFGPTTFCPPPSTKLPSPLVTAAGQGLVPVLKYLLETFPLTDINAAGLHTPAASQSIGINCAQGMKVATPLTATCSNACRAHYATTVKYLVSKGAKVNQATETGQTPLLLLAANTGACSEDAYLCEDTLKFLIENGADVNMADQYGNTLLSGEYSKLALESGADVYHRNAEGLTPLHVAARSGNTDTVKLLLDSGLSPLFSVGVDSTHPDYVPCPLYLAAISCKVTTVTLFFEQTSCPPECIANALLLLGVSEWESCRQAKLNEYWRKGLTVLDHKNVKLSYPPPRPEYDYQVEIKSIEELDAMWGTDEFMKKGLLIQCALILERCLGLNNLLCAKYHLELGDKLIENKQFTRGEKILELSMRALINYYNHLCSRPEYCYSDFILCLACSDIFLENITIMIKHNHLPNFPCYINYGIQSLECVQLLSAKASSNGTQSYINYENLLRLLLKLFLCWKVSDAGVRSLLPTLLKSFIDSYLYHPKGSTILHTAITMVEHSARQYPLVLTEEQVETFLEAVLEAGGNKVIDTTGITGERPLHIVHDNIRIATLLIEHGAHIDAVNSQGKAAVPTGTFGVPSLYCTVANAIVKCSLPYQSIGLPSRVVEFVMLHDPLCCKYT